MADELAVELGDLRVVWDADLLGALSGEGAGSPWRLEGEPDWGAVAALRVISAAFADGSAIAVAALRPAGASGHDAETVAALLIGPDGEPRAPREVLISTELGPGGEPRRLGLEIYEDEDSAPVRVAADGAREMSFRVDGTSGHGLYEVVTGP